MNENEVMNDKIKNTKTDKMWRQVCEIREKINDGVSPKFVQQEYSWLFEEYPTIFKLAINSDLELDKLRFMLDKVKSIQKGNVSTYGASGEVGTILAKEFVYPKLDMTKENNTF